MPIKCQICYKLFPNLISSSHLKTHSTTSKDYKEKFGSKSLASDEYREKRSKQSSGKNNPNYNNKWDAEQKQSLSKKLQGNQPWNKGIKVTNAEHLFNIRCGIKYREQKYGDGRLKRHQVVHTSETKEKIANGVREYAVSNPDEIKERAKKALDTKRENGYDLAFFRGKSHSKETKEKISTSLRNLTTERSKQSRKQVLDKISHSNLTLLSDVSNNSYGLLCGECGTTFTLSKQYFFDSKYTGKECPCCYPRYREKSLKQLEIAEYIEGRGFVVHMNDRTVLSGKELDIYIPEISVAIEYHGLYWHSQLVLESVGNSKTKDYDKMRLCKELGITLIQIYEDEYLNKKDIVLSRIDNLLGITDNRVYARKCKLIEIQPAEANEFLNINHVQGSGRSNVRLGLYYEGMLVSVMTFSKENISRRINGWELNRFCNKLNHVIVGGASKLFSYFTKNFDAQDIISYSDNRWSTGKLYTTLGFDFVHYSPPNYWYITAGSKPKRHHRYGLRKNDQDNTALTEWENRKLQGWNRVYDSGNAKWQWTAS